MKKCPVCNSTVFDDTEQCPGCMYEFETVIPSKEYALVVENRISDDLEDILFEMFVSLGEKYHFLTDDKRNAFHDIYVDYDSDIRQKVIEFFEECGMTIRPDGRDF